MEHTLDVVDLIATDASASEIYDAIKANLFAKSAEKIDELRPYAANSLFNNAFEDSEESEDEGEEN